ncbi:MAG: diguanylate cyclase domain-containing protein, partial [Gammaproteobacteria bacterium]
LTGSVLFLMTTKNNPEIYFNVALGIILYWIFLLAINYYGSKMYADNLKQHYVIKNLSEDLSYTSEELEKLNAIARVENEKIALAQLHRPVTNKIPEQYTDTLTGADTLEILAIKFFCSRAYALRHHQGLAVLTIDITNFNAIKTKLGEDIANLFLKAIAIRIQYCKRDTDILSRSDEHKFILIISEVLLGLEIMSVIDRLFKALADNLLINDNELLINANVGVSIFPQDGNDLQELIKKSEIALSNSSADNEESQFHFKISVNS